MRLYLALMMAVLLLAGCTKENGPQRLDFVNTARFTSSSRTSLGVADTLASRLFAENTDSLDRSQPKLGRLVVTVHYTPKRDPFVYPTPVSSISRDLIDNNPEDFVYLDSTLTRRNGAYLDNFLFTNVFGVRTTTGSERWQYDLYNSTGSLSGSRAVKLSMRRIDSLAVYNDYTLKLIIPAVGVPADVRAKSTRRFLHLRAGLAVPAYTVLRSGSPDPNIQGVAQKLTDLVVLPDGLTIVSPELFTSNTTIWPTANRRATLIYPSPNVTASTFASQLTATNIQDAYDAAALAAGTATGKLIGPVAANQVFAFRTDEGTGASPRYRYGVLLVVSIPTTTTTTTTAGLQLQVRMPK